MRMNPNYTFPSRFTKRRDSVTSIGTDPHNEYSVSFSYAQQPKELTHRRFSHETIIQPESRSSGIGGYNNFYHRSGIGNNVADERNSGIGKICVEEDGSGRIGSFSSSLKRRLSLRRHSSLSSNKSHQHSHDRGSEPTEMVHVGSPLSNEASLVDEADIAAAATADFNKKKHMATQRRSLSIESRMRVSRGSPLRQSSVSSADNSNSDWEGDHHGLLFHLFHRHHRHHHDGDCQGCHKECGGDRCECQGSMSPDGGHGHSHRNKPKSNRNPTPVPRRRTME